MDFHKTVFIDFQYDFTVFIFVVGVDGVRSTYAQNRLGHAGRKACFGPVFAFERKNAWLPTSLSGQEQAVE